MFEVTVGHMAAAASAAAAALGRFCFICSVVSGILSAEVAAIGPSKCQRRNLSITVDDILSDLYIDGVEVKGLSNADDWTFADSVPLPCSARVIAVQAKDLYVIGGIMASTNDGFIITNSSWRCTNVSFSGWQDVDFDDTLWPAADNFLIHQAKLNQTVSGIRTDAYWIWTSNNYLKDTIVYCRKRIRDGSDYFPSGVSLFSKGPGLLVLMACLTASFVLNLALLIGVIVLRRQGHRGTSSVQKSVDYEDASDQVKSYEGLQMMRSSDPACTDYEQLQTP